MWNREASPKWKFKPDVDDPRRRAKRHVVDSLSSDLGTVLDLSTVGMRVAADGKPPLQVGQSGRIRIRIPEGSLAVDGRLVWVHRKGFRKYVLGIEFLNVKRSVTVALDRLAQFGFLGVGDRADDTGTSSSGKKPNKKQQMRAMIDLPDYYAILGVKRSAKPSEIREAFRSRARHVHPDVNKNPESEQEFIKLHQAYDVLMDERRRQAYDRRKAG